MFHFSLSKIFKLLDLKHGPTGFRYEFLDLHCQVQQFLKFLSTSLVVEHPSLPCLLRPSFLVLSCIFGTNFCWFVFPYSFPKCNCPPSLLPLTSYFLSLFFLLDDVIHPQDLNNLLYVDRRFPKSISQILTLA